jgi:hypothetical protein
MLTYALAVAVEMRRAAELREVREMLQVSMLCVCVCVCGVCVLQVDMRHAYVYVYR